MRLFALVELIRPKQWLKNFFIFAPAFFVQRINTGTFSTVSIAFLAFSLAASTVYVLNDIIDAPSDRLHPKKKHRPIAAGRVTVSQAVPLIFLLIALSIALSWSRPDVLAVIGSYVAINVLYSLYLKRVVIIDVMVIGVGFVLRLVIGGLAIHVTLSSWIVICTFFISLFLGFGKRKGEVTLMQIDHARHRKVLENYTPDFLNQLLGVTAAISVLSYTLYTIDPQTISHFHTSYLIYTIPFVVYGIFHYFHLLYNSARGDDPSIILYENRPIQIALVGWLIAFIAITHA